MTKQICPKCSGSGRIPINFSGIMAYYNPETGESWPHKICDVCEGRGIIDS
jgi:hypothetical protein